MQRTKILAVILLGLWVQPLLFAQKSPQGQAQQEDYRRAVDLFQKEKYASAQYLFDRIDKEKPGNTEACYYGAVCSAKLDNNDAQYRMEEFLRMYPQSSRCNMARFYLGNYYYSRNDFTRALQYYNQVERNEVEYGYRSEFDYKKGYCHFIAKDYDSAKPLFANLKDGKTKYAESALYHYTYIQYSEGEYELALKGCKKLQKKKHSKLAELAKNYEARIYYYLGREDEFLQLAPELLNSTSTFLKGDVLQMCGEIYFNRGEYEKAIDYYQSATDAVVGEGSVACTPHDNYYQMGYCYYQLGKYDSAANYLVMKTQCNDSVAQHALYLLGDTYVKLGRKMDARSMFLQASQLNHDAKVKEDALFNYAKLSCELNQNPYNESIRSFEDYLKQYPNTSHKTEIQEILTSLYLTTRNYKDALTLIEKIPESKRNATLNQAYQRIVINRGIELFNSGSVVEAGEYFKKAIKINAVPKSTTDARYLFGEALYRQGKYSMAKQQLDKYFLSSSAKTSPYRLQALYTQAYIYMKDEQYDEAVSNFTQLMNKRSSLANHQYYDVCNRMGDCKYVSKQFEDAINYYNQVIEARDKDADYAAYQKALSYGALGKNSEKLHYLNTIFENYPNSQHSSKAMYEIANTYLICDNNEMALLYYTNFLKDYPQSGYAKEALLNMGLIYYNTDRGNDALAVLDRLLTEYPGTSEARDALSTIKNIYVEQNRVDEYFTYVKNTTKTSVSNVEQDSTTFMAAETRYLEGDCENAVAGFERYISKFPNGLFSVKAHYCVADCLFRMGQNERALPHYEAVYSTGKNQYTETAVCNAANISYNMGNYSKAASLYRRLVRISENDNSRMQGRAGVLRCFVKLDAHNDIISSANDLLQENKLTTELREEALVAMARSCYKHHIADSALYYYAQLEQSSNGEFSGEAGYNKAAIHFDNKELDKAERVIEDIINDPHSDYWLAKSFILWAGIYHARGNNLQAKQTLQSVIDGCDIEELVTLALSRRNAILDEEAAVQKHEEPVIVIEVDGENVDVDVEE